jgi:chemotaxis methyl-accepting protein methylase
MSALDLNVVTERVDGRTFDLVIATNVLIYYDVFEQALAMSNIGSMLKPGAFLLANVSVPDLTSLAIRPLDTTTTLYARGATESIRDFVVWYRASPATIGP